MIPKKREGFTLAEVLITLGIIGVVAALSTPAIIRNSQSAKIGPQLAKIVTTIEVAAQTATMEQEKTYFKDVVNAEAVNAKKDEESTPGSGSGSGSGSSPFSLVSQMQLLSNKYMKARMLEKNDEGNLPEVQTLKYEEFGDFPSEYEVFMFSDRSAVVVPTNCTVSLAAPCEIFALLPGFASRARLVLGKEVFPLFVTANGEVLTPKEAEITNAYTSEDCTDDAVAAGSISGYTCVDRIANEGWKVNY